MRRYVLVLVVGAGVVAIVLGTFVAIFLSRPETPSPEIRFTTLEETYRIGERVTFRVDNNRASLLCLSSFHPWRVERLIGGEWERVESHGSFPTIVTLETGDFRQWGWIAQSDPDREFYEFPEVLPGEYRIRLGGWLCESHSSLGSGIVLFAYFELVA